MGMRSLVILICLLVINLGRMPLGWGQSSIIARLLNHSQAIVSIKSEAGVMVGNSQPVINKDSGAVLIHRKVSPIIHSRNGSGIIISANGFIVTNAHIVQSASRVSVTLHDGTKYSATIKKIIPNEDLALLKIENILDLPYVRLANSNEAKLNEQVFSIGGSALLKHTLSEGKVRGLGVAKKYKSLKDKKIVGLLQVNFDIYEGDSGSPLFNADGKLLGIMAASSTRKQKTTFAIPSNKIIQYFKADLAEELSR